MEGLRKHERKNEMTKREKKEVAATVRAIMADCLNPTCEGDKEIVKPYKELHGNLKGLRKFVRNECLAFWTDFDPYLDAEYQDYAWLRVGKRIINLDECWCFIRDGLKEDLEHKAKTA